MTVDDSSTRPLTVVRTFHVPTYVGNCGAPSREDIFLVRQLDRDQMHGRRGKGLTSPSSGMAVARDTAASFMLGATHTIRGDEPEGRNLELCVQ